LSKCSIPFDTRKTKVYVDLFVLVPTSQRIIHGFFYKIKKTEAWRNDKKTWEHQFGRDDTKIESLTWS
jgi:hypothetical protein